MVRGQKKKYTHLAEEWLKLYNESSLNYTQIAKKYGVQTETVSRYIKPLVNKPTKSPFKEEVQTWLSHYQNGKSFAEIARTFNVSETAVKNNIYKEINPIIEDLKWTWIALYKKGYSLRKIGATYNFHPKIIQNIIKKEINIPNTDNRATYEHLIADWIKLYKEGLSCEMIAKKYDVSVNTVYKNIHDKVTMRSKKTKNEIIEKMIPTWHNLYYQKGYTLQAIANEYNISPSTIFRHIKDKY